MQSTSRINALALATAFVAGIGANQFTQREAHAQSLSAATLVVPVGGLVFRAPDGTALARISRDAHGGVFELFDDRHEMSMQAPRAAPTVRDPRAPNSDDLDGDPRALHRVCAPFDLFQ
jgi:hypothetical protein